MDSPIFRVSLFSLLSFFLSLHTFTFFSFLLSSSLHHFSRHDLYDTHSKSRRFASFRVCFSCSVENGVAELENKLLPSIYLSIPIYLSVCLSVCLSVYFDSMQAGLERWTACLLFYIYAQRGWCACFLCMVGMGWDGMGGRWWYIHTYL